MPLHGKIVVIKRSGGDGTEFPLTATCLFGRKPDCDIRIQLPQVSKEHCRIDFNENKEVILTNLSSVNPTRVNGEALQQSDRLKHGDVITIVDRSFRFEYPPEPTPKKRSSIGGKTKTLKVLQDQRAKDSVTAESVEKKRLSEVPTDPHLKDGSNHGNIQQSLEKTVEVEPKEDSSLLQSKTTSPFNDLYQMIKKSLDVKTPRKSSASLLQTPTSRFCTPKPGSVRKTGGKSVVSTEDLGTPKKDEAKMEAENISYGTPKSVKKQRRSFQAPSTEMDGPEVEETENPSKSEASSPQKRNRKTPERFTVGEVIEQVSTQTPKSPMRRRSKEATPAKPAVTKEQEEQAVTSPKTDCLRRSSPRNLGKVEEVKETSKKRKSGELAPDLPTQRMKKKRVSFGGYLCPELFDKRLPPDSPLRKGADPRRSLGLAKPKQSLLRRASVIGLLQEFEQEHPDSLDVQSPAKRKTLSPKKSPGAKNSPRTPTPAKKSPKPKTPSPKAASPAKKSPKSKTPSPKAASPAKKSPKSRSPSPKAASPAKKSPKPKTPSPKAATPAKKSAESKSPSLARGRSPSKNLVETPNPSEEPKSQRRSVTPGVQTPSVQGRFSVSRISTPSPIAEDFVTDEVPLVTVTPKLPLRRKSNSRTPNMAKSAVKIMRRRSGISRASMKVKGSWADTVKFGKPKAQVAAPAKKTVAKKTPKAVVSKPQTPARKLKDHVSTGHANSPVTIVVGRAHKQQVIHPLGAAPRLVINTALLKKNMKMDEDLTGVSEIFKTPINERNRRSVFNENSAMKTPVGGLGTSVVEPSVLNTPEEPGEMMVSPLNVSSTVKDGRYNSEAVQRLLNGDQESSFVADPDSNPAAETLSDSSEQQCADLKASVTTPKQKPELPEGLTGVKRVMKTPKQKAEPVEDLRGRLLKTPKQKLEAQECLTGVKRLMKTPKQKAEPVEDLRGRLLKTPKQKLEAQECLTGVKRLMKTPRQKAEPIEDLRGKILKTPKQKPEQQECLTGVKRIMKTPRQDAELKDLQGEHLETPTALEAGDARFEGVQELVATPAPMQTPGEKSEPVEENFGIRLMKSPRLRGDGAVEDFEGLQELMEEPVTDPAGQPETNEQVEDQTPLDSDQDVAKELDFALEEPRDNMPSDVVDMDKDANDIDNHDQVPSGQIYTESSSEAMETISQAAVDETAPVGPIDVDEPAPVGPVDETAPVGPADETAPVGPVDVDETASVGPVDVDETAPVGPVDVDETAPVGPVDETAPVGPVDETAPVGPVDVDETAPVGPVDETAPVGPVDVDETAPVGPIDVDEPAPVGPVDETVPVGPVDETAPVGPVDVGETAPVGPVDETAPVGPIDVGETVPVGPIDVGETVPVGPIDVGETVPVGPVDVDETAPVGPVDEAAPVGPVDVGETAPVGPVDEAAPVGPVDVDETVLEEQPKVETTATDPETKKKPVRGRRAKAAEDSEEPAVVAPVRGRRGKKTEATAPPAARQTTRSRNTKTTESSDVELTVENSLPLPSKVALKPKRGRNAKKASDDQAEMVQEVAPEAEMVPEPEGEQSPSADVEHEAPDSAAPLEKAALKPKRGRKTKQPEQSVPEQQDVPCTHSAAVPQADMTKEAEGNEVSDQLVVVPSRSDEHKSPDAMETVPQQPVTESLPEVETATCKVPEMDAATQKSVRGRRTKVLETTAAEEKQETTEHAAEPVVSAPVRARRGKKTEATAPPAARQTTRRRNAKSQESTSDERPEMEPEKAVETTLLTEIPTGAVADQTSPTKTHQEDNDSAPPALEAAVKPVRGRKTKQTPVEPPQPENNEVMSDEQKSIPSHGKPRRGRKTKPDTAEQNEVAEATVVTVETEQPPVRAKRGRNAKQEEEKLENDVKTVSVEATASQEPVKKLRRTRKAEQDHVEPAEIQTVEMVVSGEAEAPVVAEPVKMDEQATVAAKPRRGGRKAKQDTESETTVESTEAPAVSSTDKPKRGRRGEQAHEEVGVTAVVPEENHELQAEEEKDAEPQAAAVKPSRARRGKTSVKNELSQVIPAKRARRGAALPLEETSAESTVLVSASSSVEPAKRGRRAATKSTTDDAVVTSDQANPSVVVEDIKMSKRSVKWRAELEVFEIPKVTPVKAVRGRKSKLENQDDSESKNVSKDANKTEEKELSEKVVEAQPVKRARRGAKVADVTADKDESTSTLKSVDAETQPKTRRGRSAKK